MRIDCLQNPYKLGYEVYKILEKTQEDDKARQNVNDFFLDVAKIGVDSIPYRLEKSNKRVEEISHYTPSDSTILKLYQDDSIILKLYQDYRAYGIKDGRGVYAFSYMFELFTGLSFETFIDLCEKMIDYGLPLSERINGRESEFINMLSI